MKRMRTNMRSDKKLFRMSAMKTKKLNSDVLTFRGGIRL